MSEKRGRGRAALFGKLAAADPVPETEAEVPIPKPKGRAALLSSSIRFASDSQSSVISDSGDGRQEEKSESSGYTTTHLTTSSSGDSGSMKPRGMGRAALFGSKSSSSGVVSDLSSAVKSIDISEKSPEKAPRSQPVMKHGTAGIETTGTCNYVRLELTDPDKGIYEYEVNFQPEVDSKMMKIKLVSKHFYKLGGVVKVFDGGWRLWTPTKTENDISSGTYELNNGNRIEVTFKYKRMKSFVDCRMILNIIMKRIMGELQLVRFGRSDFNPKMAQTILEHKLEIWPGCISAIDEYEGGILLNCDASHRVLQNRTVYDIIFDLGHVQAAKQHHQGAMSSFQEEIQAALLGTSVITNYNKQIIKIDDIDFKKTPKDTFEKGGKQISYIEYYKNQYNIEIKDVNQPLLVNKLKRKPLGKENVDMLNYYIPELCSPTGLTDEQRSNFKLMRDVAKITQLTPIQRDNALRKFLRGIHENENCKKMLEDWGLKLPVTSLDVKVRTLDAETIYFGQQYKVQERSADWGRALSNAPLLSSVHLENWAMVFTKRDQRVASNFYEKATEISRKIRLNINKPHLVTIDNDRAQLFCDAIKRLNHVQIVVIIFPSQRDDRYAAVKKLCNVELGLPSQVIISRTLQKDDRALRSVVLKVILQMNCKMGGALWGVTIPHQEDGVMFCGVDAYHEARRANQSVIALVSSINKTSTRWTSSIAVHNRGQEISDMISELFRDSLQEWYKSTGSYPKRIIFYRDGVGDGQLKTVRDFEVPQLKRVFSKIHSDYMPAVSYIIVQKRINTRFYVKKAQLENPPPGTVLDHTVTRRDWYDFFLVSQNVRQGTVSPTHYVVVEDTSNMPTDLIQKVTYKMAHLYYNWNGTVRVPAPCQYAHKLAYLVGQHMHAPAAKNLRNTLYFL